MKHIVPNDILPPIIIDSHMFTYIVTANDSKLKSKCELNLTLTPNTKLSENTLIALMHRSSATSGPYTCALSMTHDDTPNSDISLKVPLKINEYDINSTSIDFDSQSTQ